MTQDPEKSYPQKFLSTDSTGFYLYHDHQGLDLQKLKEFYIELRDTILGPQLYACHWRLKEDVGIARRPSLDYTWEVYKTENGVVTIELKGYLGMRNPETNQLFSPEFTHPHYGLEILSLTLMPPLPALEEKIEQKLTEYGSRFIIQN